MIQYRQSIHETYVALVVVAVSYEYYYNWYLLLEVSKVASVKGTSNIKIKKVKL